MGRIVLWTVLFLLALGAGAGLYFGLPLLPLGLTGPYGWLLAIAFTPLAIWLIAFLIAWFLRRRRARKAAEAEAAAAPPPDPAELEAADRAARQQAALTRGFNRTVDRLRMVGGRRRRSRRRALYDLPWLLALGPPGAGTTSALAATRLTLEPAADRAGAPPEDTAWLVGDTAVAIDAPGRFFQLDAPDRLDSEGWQDLLTLLARERDRLPLTGIVAAIDLDRLLDDGAEGRILAARTLRARLQDIAERLQVRVPIYLWVTQTDRLPGFTETLDDLDRDAAEQVVGVTFDIPIDDSDPDPMAAFPGLWEAQVAAFQARAFDRISRAPTAERRGLIEGTGRQLSGLGPALEEFLSAAFGRSRYEPPALLRGVYLTSARQSGTVTDALGRALQARYPLPEAAVRQTASETGDRPLFLGRLLGDLIVPEAGLAGPNRPQERRQARRQIATALIAALIVGGLGWALAHSYAENRGLQAAWRAATGALATTLAPVSISPVTDGDLAPILPALDQARGLPAGFATAGMSPPWAARWGLAQEPPLEQAGLAAYRDALETLLLPRLILAAGESLGRANTEAGRFADLKAYLMFGNVAPPDGDFLGDWLAARGAPGLTDGDRRRLGDHLASLVAAPYRTYPLDRGLIADARDKLSTEPLPQRVYQRLLRDLEVAALPRWRPVDAAGPAATEVFTRASGAPLSEGIQGAFTQDGFHDLVLEKIVTLSDQAMQDRWVVDPTVLPGDATPAQIAALSDGVLALYLDDYVVAWDGILQDFQLVEPVSLPDLADLLNTLSGPASPLRLLLQSVATETTLVRPPPPAPEGGAAPAAGADTRNLLGEALSRRLSSRTLEAADILATLAPDGAAADDPRPPWAYVDDRFERLHRLVSGGDGNPSGLDQVISQMESAYRDVNRLAASNSVGAQLLNQAASPDGPMGDAITTLSEDASRLPPPLGGWVGDLTSAANDVAAGGVRQEINTEWMAEVVPVCTQVTETKFPFDPTASEAASLADFTALLGPNGLLDSIFQSHLKDLVNTRTDPWSWFDLGTARLGIPESALAVFQRADAIREAFFPTGSLSATFDLTPDLLSDQVDTVRFEISGDTLIYFHGPPQTQRVDWPGQTPSAGASIRVEPGRLGRPNVLAFPGAWGLFRLLAAGDVSQTASSNRLDVTWTVDNRTASFILESTSIRTPLDLSLVSGFSCPDRL